MPTMFCNNSDNMTNSTKNNFVTTTTTAPSQQQQQTSSTTSNNNNIVINNNNNFQSFQGGVPQANGVSTISSFCRQNEINTESNTTSTTTTTQSSSSSVMNHPQNTSSYISSHNTNQNSMIPPNGIFSNQRNSNNESNYTTGQHDKNNISSSSDGYENNNLSGAPPPPLHNSLHNGFDMNGFDKQTDANNIHFESSYNDKRNENYGSAVKSVSRFNNFETNNNNNVGSNGFENNNNNTQREVQALNFGFEKNNNNFDNKNSSFDKNANGFESMKTTKNGFINYGSGNSTSNGFGKNYDQRQAGFDHPVQANNNNFQASQPSSDNELFMSQLLSLPTQKQQHTTLQQQTTATSPIKQASSSTPNKTFTPYSSLSKQYNNQTNSESPNYQRDTNHVTANHYNSASSSSAQPQQQQQQHHPIRNLFFDNNQHSSGGSVPSHHSSPSNRNYSDQSDNSRSSKQQQQQQQQHQQPYYPQQKQQTRKFGNFEQNPQQTSSIFNNDQPNNNWNRVSRNPQPTQLQPNQYRPTNQFKPNFQQQQQQFTNSVAGSNKEGPEGCNIFVGHLPRELDDEKLVQLFSRFGNLISAKVYVDRRTKQSRCFGFVSFDTEVAAQCAIEQMNGFTVMDKQMDVKLKTPCQPPDGTGPEQPKQEHGLINVNKFSVPWSNGQNGPGRGPVGLNNGFKNMNQNGNHDHTMPGASHLKVGSGVEGPEGCNLFIRNLLPEIGDNELAQMFANFGKLLSAKVFVDKRTKKSRCFGFVSFTRVEAAQNAIAQMNGILLGGAVDGRKLEVQIKRKNVNGIGNGVNGGGMNGPGGGKKLMDGNGSPSWNNWSKGSTQQGINAMPRGGVHGIGHNPQEIQNSQGHFNGFQNSNFQAQGSNQSSGAHQTNSHQNFYSQQQNSNSSNFKNKPWSNGQQSSGSQQCEDIWASKQKFGNWEDMKNEIKNCENSNGQTSSFNDWDNKINTNWMKNNNSRQQPPQQPQQQQQQQPQQQQPQQQQPQENTFWSNDSNNISWPGNPKDSIWS